MLDREGGGGSENRLKLSLDDTEDTGGGIVVGSFGFDPRVAEVLCDSQGEWLGIFCCWKVLGGLFCSKTQDRFKWSCFIICFSVKIAWFACFLGIAVIML